MASATPAEKAIKQAILDRNAALHDKNVAAVMASGAPRLRRLFRSRRHAEGRRRIKAARWPWFATGTRLPIGQSSQPYLEDRSPARVVAFAHGLSTGRMR